MKLQNVTKKYGNKAALNDVTVEIEEGKITAVLGESGAGKTTLLNAIAGLIDVEGSVSDAGRVSYLFQSPKLLPNLTVEGNLKFVLPKELWGKIPDMLARVGLGGREKDLPNHLSGGERQRVTIARAFLFPHDTLLMDEPFASLDLALKKKLIELVLELWKEGGKTVVFVTHDVHEAALLSHRALVLKAGELCGDFSVEEPLPRDFFAHLPVEEKLVRTLME